MREYVGMCGNAEILIHPFSVEFQSNSKLKVIPHTYRCAEFCWVFLVEKALQGKTASAIKRCVRRKRVTIKQSSAIMRQTTPLQNCQSHDCPLTILV